MSVRIFLAESDEEIRDCYPVMSELRPHVRPEEFLSRVRRQKEIAGYRLACLLDGAVKAVAGFRVSECLAWGKFLYVDDLVSKSAERSRGYGGALFDWLVEYARAEGCDQFHLDSGVQRFDAHRFYLTRRMFIEGHHFGLKLK
jgi:GNAT superfamily N-acetyltransferase